MKDLPFRDKVGFAIGAALVAAACSNTLGTSSEKDDILASVGFAPKKANTSARIASLKALPPHQLVTRTGTAGTRYLYADPTVCGCIYVGDQNAYDRYRQQMAVRQTATDEQVRAILSTAPLPGEEGLQPPVNAVYLLAAKA